jgi:hypothetical protein
MMKIILTAVYGVAAAFVMLCGWFYPETSKCANLAAGACGFYCVLSLLVAVRPMMDAGKIAAWYWHGLSTLITFGLLLTCALRQEVGWVLVAAALAGFGFVVTLILTLVLKPESPIVRR